MMTAEHTRLEESRERTAHWKRWGPYLSERAWGTVREDYSPYGSAWEYFPHDHARSRAFRWNEDGIAGISDRHQKICFALALWNEQDPILKERLFGLTGYDNVTGKYWSTWNDSMSTGIMLSEGDCDADGACAFTGSWNDPVSKEKINARMTTRWTSPAVEVFEMYAPGPDGKESKMMEITYTRK